MTIEFSSNYNKRVYSWSQFKQYLNDRNAILQHEDISYSYMLWFYDGPEVFICNIWKGEVPSDILSSLNLTQEQNDSDIIDFETDYKNSSNKSIEKRNDDQLILGTQEPRTGKELILATHNFCDPTTWYTESVRVDDEILTDSGDGYTWNSLHVNWIDMTHGKLFDEDALVADIDHGYSIIVKVDGNEQQKRAPFATEGGDYDVNYESGSITFFSNQSGNAVSVSYSYENGSMWKLVPDAGKRIDIEQAEAQFAKDLVLHDSIVFDIYVYNPFDLPNKVLYNRTSYKRIVNFIDEALGSYPVIPAIGGSPRGTSHEVYGFPFRYGTIRKLLSSMGLELRVKLENDKVLGGEYATATMYTTVRDE